VVRSRLHHPPSSHCEPIPVVAPFRVGTATRNARHCGAGPDLMITQIDKLVGCQRYRLVEQEDRYRVRAANLARRASEGNATIESASEAEIEGGVGGRPGDLRDCAGAISQPAGAIRKGLWVVAGLGLDERGAHSMPSSLSFEYSSWRFMPRARAASALFHLARSSARRIIRR
jgi:hypothetical protein